MYTSKKIFLRPLLESNGGIHLSAYLNNHGDIIDLKRQILKTIDLSHKTLSNVMSLKERNKFLEPLDSLLLDARIFKQMKGNLGIFRNQHAFVLLSIPIDVLQTFQIASTFHVKPLLKWLQADQEFLLLGFKDDSAYLYLGGHDSIKLLDSIRLPDFFKDEKLTNVEDATSWLGDWLTPYTKTTPARMFLAGHPLLVSRVSQFFKYEYLVKTPIVNSFEEYNLQDICASIRIIVKQDSEKIVLNKQREFHRFENESKLCKNIFKISKAITEGRVQKLLISDDLNVFGKIDKDSGEITIHPFDLDHEDDDLLDDLAQMVLRQGGEVIVSSQKDIPQSRPILAILKNEEKLPEEIREKVTGISKGRKRYNHLDRVVL
jgi:hypothetical protein